MADIKLIYAGNIDKAKEQLPEGYQLLENDLNTGTGDLGVFICYSTTENRDEAITDIKVMHESGGFQRTNFKSSLEQAIDGVYGLAKEMMTAVDEFIQNFNAGPPGAVYAKDALNYFRYDVLNLLGDFMVSGKGTYKDYGKMILMCHEDILNPILSLLAFGGQQKAGDKYDSISQLLEAGYTDVIKKDMNAGTAAGKYIYVGIKRTADPNNALYGLLATTEYGKKPPATRDSYTPVSKDDLNKNTNIGKYIYLYQSKTKQLLDNYPITDIKAVGKSYSVNEPSTTGETVIVNGGIGVGDISYKEEL